MLFLLVGCSRAIPPTTLTDAEIALHMQCNDRHGQLAIGRGPQGEWVECYQGRKRIWGVKL